MNLATVEHVTTFAANTEQIAGTHVPEHSPYGRLSVGMMRQYAAKHLRGDYENAERPALCAAFNRHAVAPDQVNAAYTPDPTDFYCLAPMLEDGGRFLQFPGGLITHVFVRRGRAYLPN